MSTLISPAVGVITSGYGPRKSPGGIGSTNHKGVDIARGDLTVVAPADGVVVASAYSLAGRGNYVQIDHGLGVKTLHQHLASRSVAVGDRVLVDDRIGVMGRTGLATGVHLHTEVTVNGVLVDPLRWYELGNVRLGSGDVGTFSTDELQPTSSTSSTLRAGSTGERVSNLQAGLRRVFPAYRKRVAVRRGTLIGVDRIFGAQTDAWVKTFQAATGLVVDGLVGPITERELAKYGITL